MKKVTMSKTGGNDVLAKTKAGDALLFEDKIYTVFEDGRRGLRLRFEKNETDVYQRLIKAPPIIPGINAPAKPRKRLVAIGDETGVTAVAADFEERLEAERAEYADIHMTQMWAAGRGGY